MKLPLNSLAAPILGACFFLFSALSVNAQVQIWGNSKSGGPDQIGTIFNLYDDGSGYTQAAAFMNNPEGEAPKSALAETSEGVLIGTSSSGGLNDAGTLFKIDTGNFQKLADLNPVIHGSNIDTDILILDNGSFVVATSSGASNGAGAILAFDEMGTIEVLFEFDGPSTGSNCVGSFAYDADSEIIYGTCSNGGQNGLGTAFRYVLNSDIFSVIHHFDGASTGSGPKGGMLLGNDDLLYGTTQFGGSLGQGVIFSINPSGNVFEIVYELNNSTSDGRYPYGRLLQTASGELLGTCSEGGTSGTGTIFSCTTSGEYTRLRNLAAAADGGFPKTGLTDGEDGFYYGVAEFGGSNLFGTLYRIDPAGNFEKLHDMEYISDGSNPVGGLILSANGDLICTTSSGGANNFGTVISFNGLELTKIHDFSLPLEGSGPNNMILSGVEFYGVTEAGGQFNTGAFFKSQLSGEKTKLHDFDGTTDGQNPNGGIIEAQVGVFYGTARFGGANSTGTVYSITDEGQFQLVHTFEGDAEGEFPYAGLMQHSDGNFYGTTISGGSFGDGILYQITPGGVFQKLHDFFGFFDGGNPEAGVTEGADGLLYGLTTEGGNSNGGTLYQFDPATSTLTIMHHFSTAVEGSAPVGDLLLHSDGNFYGTTTENGSGDGSLFRYNLSTGFEVLRFFDQNTDGFFVNGSLAEDEVGTIYGFCSLGGEFSAGTAFKYSEDSGFEKIYDFSSNESMQPTGTPSLFFPECYGDEDCVSTEPCSIGVCNFGICEDIAINPVFNTLQIGFCETGLDLYDLTISVNMDISPGGTLEIEGVEFDIEEGVTTYIFELLGLPADASAIDLSYEFEATGCSGLSGNIGTAPIPCPPVETTFRVDVSDIDVVFEGVHLGGNFQGWNPSENPMTEVESDLWEITIEVGSGDYEFNFFNGSSLFDGEYVAGECAGNGKRQLNVGSESQVIEFCWEACFYDCNFLSTNEDKSVAFSLYPNPLTRGEDLVIKSPDLDENWNYFIVDITGRMVKSGNLTNGNRINSSKFSSGMYHIYLKSGTAYTRAEKFIVQ